MGSFAATIRATERFSLGWFMRENDKPTTVRAYVDMSETTDEKPYSLPTYPVDKST
jgi:hypothetical protein